MERVYRNAVLQTSNRNEGKTIVKDISFWKLDSLYIDDEDAFYANYGSVFNRGLYSNLKTGPLDIFGINYYAPEQLDSIIEKLLDK